MNNTLIFCTTAYLHSGLSKNTPGILALQNGKLSFESNDGVVFHLDASNLTVTISYWSDQMIVRDGSAHYTLITSRQVPRTELGQHLSETYQQIAVEGRESYTGEVLKNSSNDLFNAYLEGKYHTVMWIPLLRHEGATVIDKSVKITSRYIITAIILGLLLIAAVIALRIL